MSLTIVPARPHVDHVVDTAPPWTMPALPQYCADCLPVDDLRPSA